MATDTSDKKDAVPSAVVKDIEKPVEPKPVETVVSPIMTSVEENTPATSPDVVGLDGSDPTIIDTVDMGYTKTSSNKMLYVLVAVLALILMSLVALFFYRQYTNTPEKAEVTPTPTAKEVTVEKPSPSVTPVNDEDAQLQDIVIEDIDEDVASIEADLKEL